jgi:hypothetical protein
VDAPTMPLDLVRRARVGCDEPDAVARLCLALGDVDFDLVLLFVSPDADFPAVVAEAQAWLAEAHVVACTTAGEICGGYSEASIVALGFPAGAFRSRPILVPDVSAIDGPRLVEEMIVARHDLICAEPEWDQEFDFLVVDGLSTKEDELTHHLAAGLGGVPLFGGSAGDGTTFRATFVSVGGAAYRNAAVLTLVRTRCPIRVFKTDHLRPTPVKMVVTEADPGRRTVREINAEPAAREYARILGKDPDALSTATFAAHPVLVRMGEQHHVRAIQRVTADGELVFFCAIDEGLVLTLAEPEDMVAHLTRELGLLAGERRPDVILACDCILRRKEAEERQLVGAISHTLAAHKVVGFSTYGEQVGSMHVNQTLTGVAIYAPERGR